MTLFTQEQIINLNPGQLKIYPAFLNEAEAYDLFSLLLNNIPWEQDEMTIYGKTHKIPRLQAWHGEHGTGYTYSGMQLKAHPFFKELTELKQKIEAKTGEQFNSCLANLYRDGNDGMGYHSDDEKELGPDPIIASLSLGEVRRFTLKAKNKKGMRTHVLMPNSGDLLIMGTQVQKNWQHAVPKSKKLLKQRINLTFRFIN